MTPPADRSEPGDAAGAPPFRDVGWLRVLPHYFRAATLRLVLRDLYYRAPLPARLKWAVRNAVLRIRRRRAAAGPALGRDVAGPYSAALAASQRFAIDSESVQRILRHPELVAEHGLPQPAAPQVSVIIPVRDKLAYTVACLLAILRNPPSTPAEVIVVDDASKDETPAVLPRWPGLRYLRNTENLGFIGACNRGAEAARGRYLCFLNNDTNVLRGWLDELCWTLEQVPGAGLVGSKLVYPTGELQESGGILWRDGTGRHYGHLEPADHPGTSYLRDVDFVSGASLLIAAARFRSLGGFDARYAPAYYEDSDLAFRIREAGCRVLVQPASIVVHYEGISGEHATSGSARRHDAANRRTFVERWEPVLARHPAYGESPELAKERQVTRRLLMIDANTPFPDRDAGSVTADYFIRIFQQLGYKVTFAPDDLRFSGEYTLRLQRHGVECLYYPFDRDVRDVLERRGREFDLVFVSRPYVADRILGELRSACPRAKVIYNAVDLHFVRELRQAETEGNPALARRARQTREQELRIIGAADCSIVLSAPEKALLHESVPQARVEVIPLIHEEQPRGLPFAERSGLVFIGGAQHPPNLDAVRHFVGSIMPTLRAAGCGTVLEVIGEQPPQVHALGSADVRILGHVKDITPLFQRARCMVVPLRYGAGVKGKIGTAFSYGLPVIASGVGVEGMDLVEGRDYLRAETPAEWAEQVRRLGADEALWTSLSEAARRIVRERYSPARVAERLREIIPSL